MKEVFIAVSFFASLSVKAQGDFKLLKKELANFDRNDTVVVFGTFCGSCSGFSQNVYYLSKAVQSKMIIINYEFGKSKKVFDSTFSCSDCTIVVDFAKNNYESVSHQFDSSLYLFMHQRIAGRDTLYSVLSHQGQCYFLGVYSKNDFIYTFFRMGQNINRCFVEGNYLWTYFSLLRNQWPQIDIDR